MQQILDFKTDYVFAPMARFLGYIIAVIGVFGVFSIGLKSLFFFLVGLGISFTRFGVLIDTEHKRLKEYTRVFWVKFGKWELLDDYPFITVLEIRESVAMFSNANVKHTHKNLMFKITLLTENHYEKILLKSMKDRDLAHHQAKEIAANINVEKVIYSPG